MIQQPLLHELFSSGDTSLANQKKLVLGPTQTQPIRAIGTSGPVRQPIRALLRQLVCAALTDDKLHYIEFDYLTKYSDATAIQSSNIQFSISF